MVLVVRIVWTNVSVPIRVLDEAGALDGGGEDVCTVEVVLLATVLVGDGARVELMETDTVEVAVIREMLLVEVCDLDTNDGDTLVDDEFALVSFAVEVSELLVLVALTETLVIFVGAGKSEPVPRTKGNCVIQVMTELMISGLLYQLLVEQALPVSLVVAFKSKQAVVVVQYVEHESNVVKEPLVVLEHVTPQYEIVDVEHELDEADDVMVSLDEVDGLEVDGTEVLASECEFVDVASGVVVVGKVNEAGPTGGGTGSGGKSHPPLSGTWQEIWKRHLRRESQSLSEFEPPQGPPTQCQTQKGTITRTP